jgi:hypothetical protein
VLDAFATHHFGMAFVVTSKFIVCIQLQQSFLFCFLFYLFFDFAFLRFICLKKTYLLFVKQNNILPPNDASLYSNTRDVFFFLRALFTFFAYYHLVPIKMVM